MEYERTSRDHVTARLTYAEAFVLFDVLHRWEDQGRDGAPELFVDPAELRVFANLSAGLEPIIDEVFAENYDEVLERNRAAVRDTP